MQQGIPSICCNCDSKIDSFWFSIFSFRSLFDKLLSLHWARILDMALFLEDEVRRRGRKPKKKSKDFELGQKKRELLPTSPGKKLAYCPEENKADRPTNGPILAFSLRANCPHASTYGISHDD